VKNPSACAPGVLLIFALKGVNICSPEIPVAFWLLNMSVVKPVPLLKETPVVGWDGKANALLYTQVPMGNDEVTLPNIVIVPFVPVVYPFIVKEEAVFPATFPNPSVWL